MGKRAVSSGALVQQKVVIRFPLKQRKPSLKRVLLRKLRKSQQRRSQPPKRKQQLRRPRLRRNQQQRKPVPRRLPKRKPLPKRRKLHLRRPQLRNQRSLPQRNDFLTNNMLLHFNFSFTYLTMRCTIFAYSTGFYQIRPLMKMFES